MKITAIKQQVKNVDRVSIFIDGKYTFSLTLDQLLEHTLKKDQDVDEAAINVLKKLSDEGKMKAKALEWVLLRPHSEREFREYLYRKKVDNELAQSWVDEFISKKYLDNAYFARWFAEARRRKNKSNRAIASELASKGIDKATITLVTNELESNEDNALETLVQKMRGRPRYQDREKLLRYVISKGFSYSDSKKVIDEMDLRH